MKFLAFLFTIVVIWAMVSPLWGSGRFDKSGNLLFFSGASSIFSDAGVHLSLIEEMTHRFPPTNFAFGGAPLKNYHYLYDTALALIIKLTGVSSLDLYFRIAPIVLVLLLCFVIYKTTWHLTKNSSAATFSIIIGVMTTSLGVVLGRYDNLFMTDPVYQMMTNPQAVASLIIFLGLFLLLVKYETTKKSWILIFYAILLGLSFGIKAYGGIVFVVGAVAISFRTKKLFLATTIGLVLMVFLVFKTVDGSVTGVTFAPGWLLTKMMVDFEHLRFSKFELIIQSGSLWPTAGAYFVALIIYLVGSLGLRIFGIIAVRKRTFAEIFLGVCALTSTIIPLLFYQGKKAYDILQFTPYFIIYMGIMLTVFLSRFKLPVLIIFTLLILIMDRQGIRGRWNLKPDAMISQKVIAATRYVKEQTPSEALFLLAPTDQNLATLWFSSLASRRTAYSGRFFNYQVGVDTVQAESKFYDLNFDYLFVRRGEEAFFDKMAGRYNLRPVFTNEEVMIFKKV